MTRIYGLVLMACLWSTGLAASETGEKPIQHLQVADVSSMDEAKAVFLDTTFEIAEMKNIGEVEAAQIHIITYSLEKSIAYFADNLSGDKQALAKQMAVVVENIHLSSENNRFEALNSYLKEYSTLVDQFLFGF
ncbi:DUF6746 family protein [Paraferrimonas sedimenticola]|uniref:Uncharacterized protein n=1 Tax=Paraferrimonas sedimenticola TaxID=375674 RepID=A0AA37RVP9_9GAMM|nr:DUF6746 family protein [Paraferrimonas sedimenticola]GLP96300.1 hypothetical protein GCM10007895_16060 [Paraferrimonas sedimenticola]